MLQIIQSQRIERLFDEMRGFFAQHRLGVFDPWQILVPSHGVGQWLKQMLADVDGIAAQVSTDFLGAFQWEWYARLAREEGIDRARVQAPLSARLMRWRIFQFAWAAYRMQHPAADEVVTEFDAAHLQQAGVHLAFLWQKVVASAHHQARTAQTALDAQDAEVRQMLWVWSAQIAQVYANYVVYRPDWLRIWGRGRLIDLSPAETLFAKPEQPDWLRTRYQTMQVWQAWLWRVLFAETYAARSGEVTRFWQTLATIPEARTKLPPCLVVFTVIQLPPAELMFLRRLAQYVDVALLHYNPSQEYWADLVDSRWLARQQRALAVPVSATSGKGQQELDFSSPPDLDDDLDHDADDDAQAEMRARLAIELQGRETHPLLTRMGKQSRDVFKLLVQLAGGQYSDDVREVWTDAFMPWEPGALGSPATLLQQLQANILHLSQESVWSLVPSDRSLMIHACHSTFRQLEVLRDEIIQWLRSTRHQDDPHQRHPADILVLVPDIEQAAPLIRAVFSVARGVGETGAQEVVIPFEITGLVPADVEELWQAWSGCFSLVMQRFSCEALLDWLALSPVQRAYGLTLAQVARIGELLVEAGFRRGFDAAHLSAHLASGDDDVRFTFRFALDRLILGIVMPTDTLYDGCLSMDSIRRDDFELITRLEQVYQAFARHRQALSVEHHMLDWLACLQQTLREVFEAERDTRGYAGLMEALNEMIEGVSSAATVHDASDTSSSLNSGSLPLPLILEEIHRTLLQNAQSPVPTGRVTFAKLGALRPLPYRVIALLNLDGGAFPKREPPNAFDLMQAFSARVGDRSKTEDDLGALLDSLLLASDACWLFYNGQDVQDSQPRLPSAPIQELLDFLTERVAGPDIDTQPMDQIHVRHTLLPFERANFLPPAPIGSDCLWFRVAQALSGGVSRIDDAANASVSFLPRDWWRTVRDVVPFAGVLNAEHWIRDLLAPARHFLREARIGRVLPEEGMTSREPLTLNKLDEYQLREQFQSARTRRKTLQSEQWLAQLPVGAAGPAYWQKSEREQAEILQRLAQYGGELTPTTARRVPLTTRSQDWSILTHVPEEQATTRWLGLAPNSGQGRHRLRFWLEHLLWQVWRGTTDADVAAGRGQRIGVFSRITLSAPPITATQAIDYLEPWLAVWQQAGGQPHVLPPEIAIKAYTLDKRKQTLNLPTAEKIHALLREWLGQGFDLHRRPEQNENCVLHPDWQLILQGQDTAAAFLHFLIHDSEARYAPIALHVTEEDGMSAVQNKEAG